MNISPENIEISVHDTIKVEADWTASIQRRYTFTNISNVEGSLNFSTLEELKPNYSNFHAVDTGKFAEYFTYSNAEKGDCIDWAVRLPSLQPAKSYSVDFEGQLLQFIRISEEGASCQHNFKPDTRMIYSAEILYPYKNFIDHTDITVSPIAPGGDNYYMHENGRKLIIPPRSCCSNTLGPAQISMKSKPVKLDIVPMLEYYSSKFAADGMLLQNKVALIILHLLSDFHSLILALERIGLRKDNTYIVAIPYSAKEHVISTLFRRGYGNVWYSKRYSEEFYKMVSEALSLAIERCKNISGKLIILQDGGYGTTLFYDKYLSAGKICLGAVEQTANGIWECERIPREKHLFPIYDVARCPLKEKTESPYIGDAVARNIGALVSKFGISLRIRSVLVIGFGHVGSCIADSLRGDGAIVRVYDNDPDKRKESKRKHFKTFDTLEKAIPGSRFIVGCTGQSKLSAAQIASADNHTIFVNATSKLFEIDHEALKAFTKQDGFRFIEDYGNRLMLLNDKTIDILAEGLPVNFYGDFDSVPNNEIQFVPTLIFLMALRLVQLEGKLAPGILPVPEEIQKEVQELFEQLR